MSKEMRPYGRFEISRYEILSHRKDIAYFAPVFSKCVIVKAESIFHKDVIEYWAICEDFDPIETGSGGPIEVPFYDVQIIDGKATFTRR